ncbi:MAG: YiiX/YebB-like N1pC/P60 family cysteine hydrolase [Verrucomicrobiota bacterium]
MGQIRVKNRDFFITPTLLQAHQNQLEPGDILLERRNWFATNVGIPGFWPHAALYIGELTEMDAVFKDLPILSNTTASAYLETRFPAIVEKMKGRHEDGFPIRVIEARRPGVIFNSLETSAHADCLAVLRPRVSLADRFNAILAALRNHGKPYDFNFDFATDQELVCSELVYKAYEGTEGFNIRPVVINGRTLLPPNNFAETFARQFETPEQSFDLILFLDSDENTGRSEPRDVDTFLESWNRPKWYILTQ